MKQRRPWDSRRCCTSFGRWTRGPAGPESVIYSIGELLVAVAVCRRVVDDGGAEGPSETDTDTVEPVVAAESVFCERVGCAIGVVSASAFTDPVRPSMGMPETEAKTVSAACEPNPRQVHPSVVSKEAESRATNLPGETERL